MSLSSILWSRGTLQPRTTRDSTRVKLYSQSSGCGCGPAREAFSFILAPKPMLRAQPLARRRAPLGSRGAPVVAGRGGRRDHLLHHGTLCRVVHFHPQESTHERSCVELPHACRERDVSRCSAQIPGGNSQRHQHTHVPYPPPAAGTASLSLSMKLRSGSEASHLSTPSGPFGGEEEAAGIALKSAPPGSASTPARRRTRASARPSGRPAPAAWRGTAAPSARRAGPRPCACRAARCPPW